MKALLGIGAAALLLSIALKKKTFTRVEKINNLNKWITTTSANPKEIQDLISQMKLMLDYEINLLHYVFIEKKLNMPNAYYSLTNEQKAIWNNISTKYNIFT